MIRRFGEPVISGQSYQPRPGVYVILPMRDTLLLTHQEEPEPEFQLPGGGIDPGESVVAALHREVMEETGWRVTSPRRIGAYRRYTYMPEYDLWAEKICHIYCATPVRPLSSPTEAGHTALFMPVSIASTAVASAGDRHFINQHAASLR